MRFLLKPLLLPFLRRDTGEVAERARSFQIRDESGRELTRRLGKAFLGGFNAMLEAPSLEAVAERGAQVATHFRPFFFEGAAMGYLPRGYYTPGFSRGSAERDLLGLRPAYRYLYYPGLGFWYGIRHPRRPSALQELAPYIDPLYFPLCYDGYGFKLGFFDHPGDPDAVRRLDLCPDALRRYAYQGFGRSMFFVHMHDAAGFEALKDRLPAEFRDDLECGRSLGLGFTGIDRPEGLLRHIEASRNEAELGARLTGVTWALAARRMNDRDYFERSLGTAGTGRRMLEEMPEICDRALVESTSYGSWQMETRDALLRAHPFGDRMSRTSRG